MRGGPIVLALTMLLAVVPVAGQAPGTQAGIRMLAGAIDIHVHTSPDDRPRSLDAFEAARFAQAHRMRAVVLKNTTVDGGDAFLSARR